MEFITELKDNEVFVFGSNERGIHGAGAAKFAKNFGAEQYVGHGLKGKTYAIPTKDHKIQTLPLSSISRYVETFISFAKENSQFIFLVTEIGCGLAGYTPDQIAPMFINCKDTINIKLPESFKSILEGNK